MPAWLTQIVSFWNGLTKTQKITIGGVSAGVLTILLFSVLYMGRVEFANLYTDIAPQEAGKITAKLDEWKEKYQLVGTTIKVPVRNRDKLRIRLAKEELAPKGGILGYEIFDVTKLAITDYERRINFLRALQGELTRTIESLDNIEEARVLLVLPKKELFTEEEKNVTASIKLRLPPYAALETDQVRGIINLVASAVEGLSPENVTIVDNKGNILSDIEELGGEQKAEILAAKQLDLQRGEAQKLEHNIRKKLGRVLDPDCLEVVVKWEMNFDRIESKEEKYSMPGFEQLKVSDEVVKESFKGEGTIPGGAPGVEAQMPAYKGATSPAGPMSYTKDEARTNYLADKEEVIKVRSPALSKISVAVVVDGAYERDKNGKLKLTKDNKPIYTPRKPAEMTKYENLVWAAIGAEKGKIYPDRDYIVQIENVQFDRTREWTEELKAEQEAAQALLRIYIIAGSIFLLLISSLIVLMIHRRKVIAQQEADRLAALEVARRREAEGREELVKEGITSTEEESKRLALQNPQQVSQVISTWLAED
ncbi:MAG: flagellar basal-body MS-ring/collar protein FliF [bacterium]|nr:flagellar basal-body MS-ring/collar protein FliF [bacterium]